MASRSRPSSAPAIREFPHWLFEDDLPLYSGGDDSPEDTLRIIAVCSCGHPGCGSTECRVTIDEDVVVFRDGRKEFRVARGNYDAVVSAIVAAARACRAGDLPT
jgi:hypothetical protein